MSKLLESHRQQIVQNEVCSSLSDDVAAVIAVVVEVMMLLKTLLTICDDESQEKLANPDSRKERTKYLKGISC